MTYNAIFRWWPLGALHLINSIRALMPDHLIRQNLHLIESFTLACIHDGLSLLEEGSYLLVGYYIDCTFGAVGEVHFLCNRGSACKT